MFRHDVGLQRHARLKRSHAAVGGHALLRQCHADAVDRLGQLKRSVGFAGCNDRSADLFDPAGEAAEPLVGEGVVHHAHLLPGLDKAHGP